MATATGKPQSQRSFIESLRVNLIKAPWILAKGLLRVLYQFEIEGEENLPEDGPAILALTEPSAFAMVLSGWISIQLIERLLEKAKTPYSYLQEELFGIGYFRQALQVSEKYGKNRPLSPVKAGNMVLNLMEGLRNLHAGGVVVINPEGDATWDGRPVTMRGAIAWLALHSGAPIVPALATIGAYDAWPRWRPRLYFRGKLKLRILPAITVTDAPVAKVTDDQIQACVARLTEVYEQTIYGPGGVDAWQGAIKRNERRLERPPRLPLLAPRPVETWAPQWRRRTRLAGIGHLLWRCPVCHSPDAIEHQMRWTRPDHVRCRACRTEWDIVHVPEHDFRLVVTQGPEEIVGLDMPLSRWYDEMKRDAAPEPMPTPVQGLAEGEQVYLRANSVRLAPSQPSPLFDGWIEPEAPKAQPATRRPADYQSIGEGELLLTSERLLWRGDTREVEFHWPTITAAYLWMNNQLILGYGTAQYRLELGPERGLKWLTHISLLARRAGDPAQSRIRLPRL